MTNDFNFSVNLKNFSESLEVRIDDQNQVLVGRIFNGRFLVYAIFSETKAIELRDKLVALLGGA